MLEYNFNPSLFHHFYCNFFFFFSLSSHHNVPNLLVVLPASEMFPFLAFSPCFLFLLPSGLAFQKSELYNQYTILKPLTCAKKTELLHLFCN